MDRKAVLKPVLASLPPAQASYLDRLADRALENPAWEGVAHWMILLLAAAPRDIPPELDVNEAVALLSEYTEKNVGHIQRCAYGEAFLREGPTALRDIALGYAAEIAARALERHHQGVLEADEPEVSRFTTYSEEELEEWEARYSDLLDRLQDLE